MLRANRQNNELVDQTYAPDRVNDVPTALRTAGAWLRETQKIELIAVGHRVVHGGPEYAQPVIITDRAIPAMALVAIMAAILTVWSMQPSAPAAGYGLEDEALTDTRDPGVEQTILTRNALSRDEVFSIVVDRNAR